MNMDEYLTVYVRSSPIDPSLQVWTLVRIACFAEFANSLRLICRIETENCMDRVYTGE